MAEAFGLIDEAMLTVMADEIPVEWAGDIYCLVLHHCNRVADFPRMRAWTQSMERWCEDSGAQVYGGVCEMHRLHLLTATEDYRLIEGRLFVASRKLEDVNTFAAAAGFYELGEIRRLRGDVEGAAAAFAQARSLGVDPQPGEALVRTRQGDSGPHGPRCRRLWHGRTGSVGCACCARRSRWRCTAEPSMKPRRIVANSKAGAETFGTPGFKAWAAHARGAVLVQRDRLRLGARRATGRVARVPNSTVPVRNGRGLRMDGGCAQSSGRQRLAAADAATAESICRQLGVEPPRIAVAAVAGGADSPRDRGSDPDRPRGDQPAGGRSSSSSATRPSAVIWRTSTPNSVSRRALRPCHGRTPTRSSTTRAVPPSESTAYIVCTISARRKTHESPDEERCHGP